MKTISRNLTDLRVQLSLYPEFAQTFSRTSITTRHQHSSILVTGSQVFTVVLERLLSVTIGKKPMLESVFSHEYTPCYPHVFFTSSGGKQETRYADAVPENDIRVEVCKAVQVSSLFSNCRR
jgi:hypothetical protein